MQRVKKRMCPHSVILASPGSASPVLAGEVVMAGLAVGVFPSRQMEWLVGRL